MIAHGRCVATSVLILVASGLLGSGFYVAAGNLLIATVVGLMCSAAKCQVGHRVGFRASDKRSRYLDLTMIAGVILLVTLPMGWCPYHNGQEINHRNQYELMANAIIAGRIHIKYQDTDTRLEQMENPYDPHARQQAGVTVHWDHVYYNGQYYMYFGVVPTILLFVPFKLLTGASLATYHATQIFTGLFVLGLFFLMKLLSMRYFSELPQLDVSLLFVTFSLISTWYFASAPALYSTAMSSAICFQVWSFYFFAKMVMAGSKEGREVGYALLGSLCGALVVGCRPTVACANVIAIPLFVQCARRRVVSAKLLIHIVFVCLPPAAILGLLMIYNWKRFGSAVEFGQSYQLTLVDLHQYRDKIRLSVGGMRYLVYCFFGMPRGILFPGIFWEYPVLLAVCSVFVGRPWRSPDYRELRVVALLALAIVLVIILPQAIASPLPAERYKSDELWIMCIVSFISIGVVSSSLSGTRREVFLGVTRKLAVLGAATSVFLFFIPNDSGNLTSYYWKDIVSLISVVRAVHLW